MTLNLHRLLLFVIAWIVVNLSVNGFAQVTSDLLKNVPHHCSYVAFVNVQQMVASPLFHSKSVNGKRLIGELAEDLIFFAKETGIDPLRDVSDLAVCERLIIAKGTFNKKQIRHYIKSQNNIDELKYGETPYGFSGKDSTKKQIAFLSDDKIALGEAFYVSNAYRAKAKLEDNILSKPLIASLVNSVPPNVMLWFAGATESVFDKSPVPLPVGTDNFIVGIAGAFNFTDALNGKIAIATKSPAAADSISGLYRKIEAAASVLDDYTFLKLLFKGLSVRAVESQVNFTLDYSAEMLEKMNNWDRLPFNPYSFNKEHNVFKVEHGVSAPVVISRRLPSYTKNAQRERISGIVRLQCIVRRDGIPEIVHIIKGLETSLDESAINTVRAKWRFIPSFLNGKPVDVVSIIEVVFRVY